MAQLFIPYPVRESLLVAASHSLSSGFLEGLHESGVLLFSRLGSAWSVSGFMKIPFKEGEDKGVLARQLFGEGAGIALAEYDHLKEGGTPNKTTFFFYNP